MPGPGENIFIIKEGLLITNDKTESVLEGITRASVLEMAKDLGIKTHIGPMTKEDLFQADEIFFSGTAIEITPIISVADGSNPQAKKKEYTIGSGKAGDITKKLAKTYMDAVRGNIKEYEKWLSHVGV